MIRLFVTVAMVTVTFSYEGCKVRYGARNCVHRRVDGVLVTCDGYGTETTVPLNLPQDTVYMSLKNFKLSHLKPESLMHLSTVECLSIFDSGIGQVEPDAFSGMVALKELVLQNTYMNDSQVDFITHGNFRPELLTLSESPKVSNFNFGELENLEQLKTLDIHGNGIRSFSGDIFDLVLDLENLDVSENNMEVIDWSQVKKLDALNTLRLHGNGFQTIPAEMYGQFFAVKELTLGGNPFHCNCKLAWLKEFYDTAQDKELDYDYVTCASPTPMASLRSKKLSDFRCSPPTKPMIEWIKMEGDPEGRFQVNCTSHGDPAPELTLTLPNEQRVIIAPSTNLADVRTQSPHILTQPGLVQCDAINSEGTAFSTEQLPMPDSATSVVCQSHMMMSFILASIIYVLFSY